MKPIRGITGIAVILLLFILVQGVLAADNYTFVNTLTTSAGRVGGSAVDSTGHIYITDRDNGDLLKFSSTGLSLGPWGPFSHPGGVATDSNDNVYVVEEGKNQVVKLSKSGYLQTTWKPVGYLTGTYFLPGIAVGPDDNIYTLDSNQQIQVFDTDGSPVMKWTYTHDPEFYLPRYIAADHAGYVYVTMTENHKIFKFTTSGTFVTSWDSRGPLDQKYGNPRGISVDNMNNVFVANAQVPVYDSSGNPEATILPSVWMAGTEYGPPLVDTVATGQSGKVYVSGNYHIDEFQAGGSGISVTSDPPGAEIIIDGADTGQATPASLSTSAGDHSVTVTMPGYHTPVARTVTVSSGVVTGVGFTLVDASVFGTLHVTSSQGGAEIFIDGTDSGKATPVSIDLAPDTYDVYVMLAGYQTPAHQSATITESSTTDVDFSLVAIPSEGILHVTSTPDHAEIIVNGADTGLTTPASLGEPEGTYAVYVTLAGYVTPNPQNIPVTKGMTSDVDFPLTASPTSGTIHVISDPANAEIFIDSKDAGKTTPASIEESPGTYKVQVMLAGYQTPALQNVAVETGKASEVSFQLTPNPAKGTIHVTSSPIDAEVFVNGADTGKKTPADIDRFPGTYKVTVGGFEYYQKPAAQSVTVNSGVTTSVDFPLQAGGRVQVTVDFGGGKIFLDGYDTGTWTPGLLDGVAPGHHSISVFDFQPCGLAGGAGVDVSAFATSDVQVSMKNSCGLAMYGVTSACPVKISVTDPAGHGVNSLKNEIDGATYLEYGPGEDGKPDSRILIPGSAGPGVFLVTVTPRTDALPADTFTLTLTDPEGKITVLADKVPVSEIPAQPYSFTIPQSANPVPEFPAASVPVLCIALTAFTAIALKAGKK